MSDEEAMNKCDCQSDCSSTYYSYAVSSTKIDVDEFCNGQNSFSFGQPLLSDTSRQ